MVITCLLYTSCEEAMLSTIEAAMLCSFLGDTLCMEGSTFASLASEQVLRYTECCKTKRRVELITSRYSYCCEL